jgi:hypothetical protein
MALKCKRSYQDQSGVLPDWTAHRGDVRCGGRPQCGRWLTHRTSRSPGIWLEPRASPECRAEEPSCLTNLAYANKPEQQRRPANFPLAHPTAPGRSGRRRYFVALIGPAEAAATCSAYARTSPHCRWCLQDSPGYRAPLLGMPAGDKGRPRQSMKSVARASL